jgi:hypothetical protein
MSDEKSIRYDNVIATLIGLLAICVAAYTAYIQRQQVRAQHRRGDLLLLYPRRLLDSLRPRRRGAARRGCSPLPTQVGDDFPAVTRARPA